jgi:glycosyltransferase involved in cell wall biosynthesis
MELKNTAIELNKFISKNNLQIDIIETHDFEGVSLFLDKKIPYVIRCHGCFSLFYNYFNIDVKKHIMDWEREAFNKAKNIITISKYSESLYKELFYFNKSKLIYNGIDTEKFKNIEGDLIPKSIFYLGNTSIEKGADIAIKVFIELLKKEPNSTLHFIGRETGYNNDFLQIISDNHITEKVFLYGFQPVKEIVKLISKAETVIFPSKGETFGLALCETMAIGKPVVVSNIGSFNEIIENMYNGIIANTIQDYIDSIVFLFENKQEAIIIGKNARKTILEKFNKTNLLNETLNYYQEVIINHRVTDINE